MFETSVYQERRKKLSGQLDTGLLLFLGNEESPMNYEDNTYHFRQDSSFLYFFGLDMPGLATVIDLDENREVLFGYDFTVDDIIWMGPQPKLSEKAEQAGINESLPISELKDYLHNALEKGRTIHYLPPYRAGHLQTLSEFLQKPLPEVKSGASKPFIKAVVALRSVKSDAEVAEIEKALDITCDMHNAAMRMVRPGIREQIIAGAMQGIAAAKGAGLAFPTIFSINGQTLHNHSHHNILQEGRMVVNDSGAAANSHYAGDITRTLPVSGKFTDQQKEIYEIVLEAQLKAIEEIRPEITFKEVHLLASRVIAEGLTSVGLMRGDTMEAVAQGAHALFFPHGLGHMMGLDVHDMENLGEQYVGYDESVERSGQFGLAYLRLAKPLKTGFVLTVEPGIYFIPELIDLWEKEKKFEAFIDYKKVSKYRDLGGIRIEDDVLLTENGHRVLGKPIPKTVDEIENFKRG
ncbi:MAG: aminopeptidase P family protein [Calditrichia bacterium]